MQQMRLSPVRQRTCFSSHKRSQMHDRGRLCTQKAPVIAVRTREENSFQGKWASVKAHTHNFFYNTKTGYFHIHSLLSRACSVSPSCQGVKAWAPFRLPPRLELRGLYLRGACRNSHNRALNHALNHALSLRISHVDLGPSDTQCLYVDLQGYCVLGSPG
jgi:hypothetical protein